MGLEVSCIRAVCRLIKLGPDRCRLSVFVLFVTDSALLVAQQVRSSRSRATGLCCTASCFMLHASGRGSSRVPYLSSLPSLCNCFPGMHLQPLTLPARWCSACHRLRSGAALCTVRA